MRRATRPIPNATNVSLYLFSFHAFSRPYAPMGLSQPLSYQSFPHSFPWNGGGAINLLLPRATNHESPFIKPANLPFCFQHLPRCPSRNSFPFILLHRCRGVCRGVNAFSPILKRLPKFLASPVKGRKVEVNGDGFL